jgi:hypothetical protein
MHSAAVVDSARSAGPGDHLCWRYDHHDEFVARAVEFLSDGLAAGLRVLYVAPGDVATLTTHLRAIDDLDEALRRGAVQVASLDATYPVGTVVDPVSQVRTYAAATEEALAVGFRGLRVAAEATDLIRTPAQLDAFARYEHLVDRYMARHPFSAMCSYDRREVGDDAVAQIACMHPGSNTGATPFHLHARVTGNGSVALDGEVDAMSHDLLALALERAGSHAPGDRLVIDATDLRFIDHRSLLTLAEHAERHSLTAVLRTRLSSPAQVVDVLNVRGVRVERVA